MRTILVDPYPIRETYTSFREAIVGVRNDPLQSKAKADAAKLLGSRVENACWTDTNCVVQFSNGLFLHIWVDGETLSWLVTETPPALDENASERIGAPGVMLSWPNAGDRLMDQSELAAKRLGSEFYTLFVTGGALLVYCRGHSIWWFAPTRRRDTGRSMLYVTEEE